MFLGRNFYVVYRVLLLGLQNFVRNTWLTIAATLVVVTAISAMLTGVIFNTTFHNITTHLSQNLKVSVYFQQDVSRKNIDELQSVFDNHALVTETIYVSSQSARDRFVSSYGDDIPISQAVALVGDNIFPASLEISVVDLNQINTVGVIAESSQYTDIVESISLGKTDAKRTIERAQTVQNTLMRISIILALASAAVAALIIFNTIRMAIFSRREEIQIMRLLGASSRFIREPFLVEAGLYGAVGGIMAFSLIYGLIWSFSDRIIGIQELSTSYAYFVQDRGVIFLVFCSAIGSGVLISTLSCALALQRHLRF